MIYELGPSAGQFWPRFPVAKELISINANHPSERYDWHGLLGAPLRFRNVSKRYFPHRSDFHAYLNAVAATLNVEYETKVARLVDGPCVLLAPGAHTCACHRVFVGTGTEAGECEEIAWPVLESAGSVLYGRFNVSTVEGVDVCILGNGNKLVHGRWPRPPYRPHCWSPCMGEARQGGVWSQGIAAMCTSHALPRRAAQRREP